MALSWVTPEGTLANFLINERSQCDIISTGLTPIYEIYGGELPPGLSLNSATGTISGTPVYSNSSNNYFTTLPFTFSVKATDTTTNETAWGTFTIIISNTINGDFYWITPEGNLGTVPSGKFYDLTLQSFSGGRPVTYSFISGELPPGMQIIKTGHLQGVPTILNALTVNASQTYRFTIRATNNLGHINDRSFSLSVTNVYGPIIRPTQNDLGSYFDGSFFNQQLRVDELNPQVKIQWSLTDGSLPEGISLSSTGLLSGYIQPLQLVGDFGPANYDSYIADPRDPDIVVARAPYDGAPYAFNQANQNLSYSFTIQAYDGANYDLQSYTISVISRSGFTADSSLTVDNDFLTVDSGNVYVPIILNAAGDLPVARQDSYYAYKFDGYDFQGDSVKYFITATQGTFDSYLSNVDEGFDFAPFDSFNDRTAGTSNLPGVTLDSASGWLYGKVSPQSTNIQTYTFGIYASKTRDGIEYRSNPVFFNFSILGDVNNVVEWLTSSDLGTINNGTTSELKIEAKSIVGKPLVYSLYDHKGVSCRLPQGLTLLPSGELSGRVSFEAFAVDDFNTTFDKDKLTFDRSYTFAVVAATNDNSASAIKQFTIKLGIIDEQPYENLYLKALPEMDQRQIYSSVINDADIFNPALIYRPTDPYYGIQQDIKMLFLPGLTASDLNSYEEAMVRNHYTKNYKFGDIKNAVVLDDNYNVKYEVVYVEIVDPEENSAGKGPGLELNLNGVIANPYSGQVLNNNDPKIVYPNTSNNMITRLEEIIGYQDQSSLPAWMTSNQPDPNNASKFKTPLGYTKAVVMAYTIPGSSKLIAYRLKNTGINFNRIPFVVDRYQVDNFYTTNFQVGSMSYERGNETTFDSLSTKNIGEIVATVTYGLQVPFSEINGRPISYINARGGLDGSTTYFNGDTVVFLKQENFLNPPPYEGWVDYSDLYIGDNIGTQAIEGYDSSSYDTYNVVPGFLEKTQDIPNVIFSATLTNSLNNQITVSSTAGLIEGMPVMFVGSLVGGLTADTIYYISSVVDSKHIILASDIKLKNTLVLSNGTGTMTGRVVVNKRGGVWRVNIFNNIVSLTFIKEVNLGQRVRILSGSTFASAIVYYSIELQPGQNVPFYKVYNVQPNDTATKTTFNNGTTRFFNYRDQYYAPGTEDKYVKFPQYGVFY